MEMDIDTALGTRKRNPAILRVLDPMHRSLLHNNLRYEQESVIDSSEEEHPRMEDSDSEYLTSVSTLISTDTDGNTENHQKYRQNVGFDASVNDNRVKGHECRSKPNRTALHNAPIDADNHLIDECNRHRRSVLQPTKINVLATENRCDTNHYRQRNSNSNNNHDSNINSNSVSSNIIGIKQQQFGAEQRLKLFTQSQQQQQQSQQQLHRRSSKNSSEGKQNGCLSDKLKQRNKRSHTTVAATTQHRSCTDCTTVHSDSSDINSEINLVIENMRNRESEMYQKISFNNGYYSTTGDSSCGGSGDSGGVDDLIQYSASNTNGVALASDLQYTSAKNRLSRERKTSTTTEHQCNDVRARKSPKATITKRKCRSFPLTTDNRHNDRHSNDENLPEAKATPNRTILLVSNDNGKKNQTKSYQNSQRKITITIRSRTIPEQQQQPMVKTISNRQQQQSIENYLTNACEISDESDTTVSDYATLRSQSDPICVSSSMQSQSQSQLQSQPQNGVNGSHSDDNETTLSNENSDDISFFSINSDTECRSSETSQYYNCVSFGNLNVENDFNMANGLDNMPKSDENNCDAVKKRTRKKEKKVLDVKKASTSPASPASPMICIEHEVSENRIVTSRIEVDKAKIKEFKRRQNDRSKHRHKIIDSSFSEDIFKETLNRKRIQSKPEPEPEPEPEPDISNDPHVINEIVESIRAEERERYAKKMAKNARKSQCDMRQYLNDGYMFNNQLPTSPQHATIVQRIEKHTLTNVRRSLLRNVAYAITESERQEKLFEKKKVSMAEMAPIKPPRSFIASSSSSPLSKESFESSATVPVAEINHRLNQNQNYLPMGFVMPTSAPAPAQANAQGQVGEESTMHFGWVRPHSNLDNEDPPSSQFETANQIECSIISKISKSSQVSDNDFVTAVVQDETIDMVDGPMNNKDFARFSAKLTKNRCVNLSTPIKKHTPSAPSLIPNKAIPNEDQPKAKAVCEKCNCQTKQSPQHLHLGRTGKWIGRAALKRTKTLIGTSKKLLKKPSLKRETATNNEHPKCVGKENEEEEEEETFHTPMKDGDNTVRNNRDTTTVQECPKRINKSLNLTPNTNHYAVQLNPSPNRVSEVSNVRLLNKETEGERNDSDVYVTPDEAFDFNRMVDLPQSNNNDNVNHNNNNHNIKMKALKRSPSKMMSKLANSSKKFFGLKVRDESRDSATTESTHYYKANDYDEFDHKVLLMGEMLSEMRKRIENVHGSASCIDDDEAIVVNPPPSSAKKCLFRDRTISTSSGDLLEQESLVKEIARIDIHDEPEPLYAEIVQKKQHFDKTLYRSCIETDEVDAMVKPKPPQLQELYIGDTNKYIMVNNNPKLLYATVNRNSVRGRSLETIESKIEPSEADKESLKLSSSYESLDMSLINDFATAMQTELEECQSKMNGMFAKASNDADNDNDAQNAISDRQSNSGTSIAISDMNSGCSSFYRRNKEIVGNFNDTLSFDTVGTGSYCESLSRGNDVNSEIKDTITSLEYMPSETGDSTDSRDLNAAFRSCLTNNDDITSSDSSKFISMVRRPESDSIESSPRSSLYQSLGKNESPSKKGFKKMSPNLRFLKSKLRSSFRMDSKKSTLNKSDRFDDCYPIDEYGSSKASGDDTSSHASTASGHSATDSKRKKLFESICGEIKMMPNSMKNHDRFDRMIENIRQQQHMRQSMQHALEMCRSTDEFHNSRELIEAEQLMLMSCLKECSALEELIMLWQSNGIDDDDDDARAELELGTGTLTIKYFEFELRADSIYDAHFNYFYLCVCTYRDQVEVTRAKERQPNNRIMFSNLRMQFYNLTPDFAIRVEVYALRLRKNVRKDKTTALSITSHGGSSRFRLQGRTLLTSSNLSRRRSPPSSYQSPQKLVKSANGDYVHTSHGLISSSIVMCGQSSTLFDSLKIGYQEQLQFMHSKANGFLNIADSKQKWDRLWCRIDGFSMKFWKYPQDRSDTEQPLLILDLDRCNHRNKTLIVDREICPKPRTFKIDIIQMPSDIHRGEQNRHIQSYFISAENQLDLELWLSEIQQIFAIINSWNI